jgi:hypothetical protein
MGNLWVLRASTRPVASAIRKLRPMPRFHCSRRRRRSNGPDWWTYFGSFGDDFFGDDADETSATADVGAS